MDERIHWKGYSSALKRPNTLIPHTCHRTYVGLQGSRPFPATTCFWEGLAQKLREAQGHCRSLESACDSLGTAEHPSIAAHLGLNKHTVHHRPGALDRLT